MNLKKMIPATALFAIAATSLHAGVASYDKKFVVEPEVEEESLCDIIFGLPTLYSNKEGAFLQEFKLIGRYHGQYHWLDSNQGNNHDWENRRQRLGFSMKFLDNWDAAFQFNLDFDDGRFFSDIEDFRLRYKVNSNLRLTVGKMKAPITNEWRTSSNENLTFERSRIINQVVPNRMGGVYAEINTGPWLFELGAFTTTMDSDWAQHTFDGGFSLFGSVGYKADIGTTRLEYLYSDIDTGASGNVTRGYEHVVSLNYEGKFDRFGLVADVIFAAGSGNVSDVYGFILMPSYDITDKLQAVFRYQIAGSDSSNGFQLQSRYEREAPNLVTSRGDMYQAAYLGLNYRICGDNLKLMTGVEYTTFEQTGGSDYDAWTTFSGVRVSF